MIRALVAFSAQAAAGEPRRYWLRDLFERGFVGYRNFSNRQLRRELQLRGLVRLDDLFVDDEPEESASYGPAGSIPGYAEQKRDTE